MLCCEPLRLGEGLRERLSGVSNPRCHQSSLTFIRVHAGALQRISCRQTFISLKQIFFFFNKKDMKSWASKSNPLGPEVFSTEQFLSLALLSFGAGYYYFLGSGGLSCALQEIQQDPGLGPRDARNSPTSADVATETAFRPC